MKIGIDARLYGPKQGGLGRYLQQLIEGLEKTDLQNDYVVFLRQENFFAYTPVNPRFKKALADVPWYGWQEQILLPRILKKENCDFVHFPHWNIPVFYNKKFIVTIHDLILFHYPSRQSSTLGPLKYFFKNLAYRFILRHAVKKATQIITPSNFTKQDVTKNLHVPEEKITVTYLAPVLKNNIQYPTLPTGRQVSNTNNQQNNDKNQEILQKHGITKNYLLYVGVAYPHKNLERLVRAWKMFEKQNKNFQLVLVGKKNYFYDRLINSEIFKSCKDVIFTDFILDENLVDIYKNSSAYIFPSLYEGFGLPPLEAMQYGIPVISSNKTCLPEILGDAALYFEPQNEQDICSKINLILTDSDTRQKLINNIPDILSKYSQKNTAETTLSVYKKMV